MKMKKFLLVGLLGVVTLCGLSSCDDDDDGGYVPFSYAVGDMVVKDGSEPYYQLVVSKHFSRRMAVVCLIIC